MGDCTGFIKLRTIRKNENKRICYCEIFFYGKYSIIQGNFDAGEKCVTESFCRIWRIIYINGSNIKTIF